MTEPILMEQHSTGLSLAVSLVDDYTDSRLMGSVELFLDEKKALLNPSGYYLFMDVADGDYTLRAQTDYYSSQEQDVTLPLSGEPAIELTLKPTPAYPFPRGATLIRGIVQDNNEKPVAGVTVEIEGKGIENKTTEKGEFVIYFKNLTEEDIIKIGGKTYVRGNGNEKLKVKVTHPDYRNKTVQTEVEEGKTVSLYIEIRRKGG